MIVDLLSSGIVSKNKIKKFIMEFAKNDNWHNIDLSSANLGYAWIHYAFIRVIKPERVLCVGSKYGYIPAICALACKDNGKGMVDFVDAGYDQNDKNDINHWGGVGLWKTDAGREKFKSFGLEDYIEIHVQTTVKFKNKNQKRNWDYIYLDGDHSYVGVKNDFDMFYKSLNDLGFLVFHDIYTKDLGDLKYGVNSFWTKMKKNKKYNMIEFGGDCGLGLIQKN